MIGLGTWEAEINTLFYKGVGRAIISDVNGAYDFRIEIPNMELPQITIYDVLENGNTLTATAECALFKNRKIPITATFEGDTVTGMVKAPMIGKVNFSGKKIA